MSYFITAIGTDSGKTLVSSIFCKALGYSYWKPIQAGLEQKDADFLQQFGGKELQIFPSAYELNTPMSPHAAAEIDGVQVELGKFILPTENKLIVEGAGGVMVPLTNELLVLDLIEKLALPVVLVSNIYLGSINHTILSFEMLKARNIKMAGIVFNGETVESTKSFILNYTKLKELLHIQPEKEITEAVIEKYATELRSRL